MDELKKLTQPYGDEDDFYEGADESFTAPPPAAQQSASNAQEQFESSFADEQYSEPEPAKKKLTGGRKQSREQPFQQRPQKQQRRSNQRGGDPQVVLFNPKSFDEAGELASYLMQGRSLVMALEGIAPETARRLLDFISGIAFALNAKITPVSAKTYFVTPENVDLLGTIPQEAQSDNF